MSQRFGWQFHTEDRGWRGGRVLYLGYTGYRAADGFARSAVAPFTLVSVEPNSVYDTPTLSETFDEVRDGVGDVTAFLQAALEEAWRVGIRPRGFADHTNELTAVRYHLEDMRKIAKVPGAV